MCGLDYSLGNRNSLDDADRDFMERIDLNSLIDQFDRERISDQTAFSDIDSELSMLAL